MERDELINIYDLAELDAAEVQARVDITITKYPKLRMLYDPEFVTSLVADRSHFDNYLLLLLADVADTTADQFWRETSEDLVALEAEGAFESFGRKFRQRDRVSILSAKTELEFAAWAKRKGHAIILEPINPVNGRRGEFSAASTPPTWWEVKSILDVGAVREDDRAFREVYMRLRRIDEPYVLDVETGALSPSDAPAAVRAIRHRIREFHTASAGGTLPVRFESHGLIVELTGRSRGTHGYLSTSEFGYEFTSEYIVHVLNRIGDAVSQIPKDSAGIIVIDTSMADWADEDDVEEACYGESGVAAVDGHAIPTRRVRDAAFRPGSNTRVSAVIYYRRRNTGDRLETCKKIYHNPYAQTKLPFDLLRDAHIEQVTCVELAPGRYRLEETS